MVWCCVAYCLKERNQKKRFAIHNASQTCSEVLIYIKYEMFNDPGSKVPIWTRSKSNERWNVIRLELFRTVNGFSSALFHQHYVLFKIITNDVEIQKWKTLLIWFLFVNRVWINRSSSSINHSLSWTCLSVILCFLRLQRCLCDTISTTTGLAR